MEVKELTVVIRLILVIIHSLRSPPFYGTNEMASLAVLQGSSPHYFIGEDSGGISKKIREAMTNGNDPCSTARLDIHL